MASESMSTFAAMLKDFYTLRKVAMMVFRNAPLLAMLPKNEEIEGSSWEIPVLYAEPQAGSATFATGLANKGTTKTVRFAITTANEYSFASIDRKVIKASRSNKGAFLPAVKPNVDGAINTSKRSLGIQAYRSGSGAKGQVNSVDDSGTNGILTLGNSSDGNVKHEVVNWQVGEKIQFCATETGGTLKASGATLTILAINKASGTITVSGKTTAVFSGGDALAQNDFMYRAGDYDGVIKGLKAHLPPTAPTSTAFFGVDRSVDTTALGGVIYDGTGQPVHEALIDFQSSIATIGDGNPDHIFLHPSQFRALTKEMGNKVVLDTYKVNQDISFKGFTIQGDAGEMRVIPDRYALYKYAHGLQLDTWELGSMGVCPDIFDRDSDQEMLREASADAYEMRFGGYVNLGCHAPGYNGNCLLDVQA